MARIAGVDLPRDKRIVVGLTYIFGMVILLLRRFLKMLVYQKISVFVI